jgi:hypothetical protein
VWRVRAQGHSPVPRSERPFLRCQSLPCSFLRWRSHTESKGRRSVGLQVAEAEQPLLCATSQDAMSELGFPGGHRAGSHLAPGVACTCAQAARSLEWLRCRCRSEHWPTVSDDGYAVFASEPLNSAQLHVVSGLGRVQSAAQARSPDHLGAHMISRIRSGNSEYR